MIHRTDDLRITRMRPLLPPAILMEEHAASEQHKEVVVQGREGVTRILRDEDDRLLVVVGPCSIHDPRAALEYASRLAEVSGRYRDDLCIVMRVYFEKPRTTIGWKGATSCSRPWLVAGDRFGPSGSTAVRAWTPSSSGSWPWPDSAGPGPGQTWRTLALVRTSRPWP